MSTWGKRKRIILTLGLAASLAANLSPSVSAQSYTVKAGDSLYRIATMHKLTVNQLMSLNRLSGPMIYPGQVLSLGGAVTTSSTMTSTATKPTATVTYKVYTVVKGDYLTKIANQFGVTVNQIKSWNGLTSNLIFVGQKLRVSVLPTASTPTKSTSSSTTKPATTTGTTTKPTTSTAMTTSKPTTTSTTTTKPTSGTTTTPKPTSGTTSTTKPASVKTYTVKSGDYLNKIASMHGISLENLMNWNKLTSYMIHPGDVLYVSAPSSVTSPTTTSNTGVHTGVQAVLNKYFGAPINVYFQMNQGSDQRTASLRGDSLMYGASVPKIVLAAYTQDRIARGLLTWNTSFKYDPNVVNRRPESYLPSGSGSIQTLNPVGKYFTVRDIVQRTMAHSDNIGSNMLLHYVGYKDKADFDAFVRRVYGAARYDLAITPKQATLVMNYLKNQKEQVAFQALDRTNYDGTKMDVVGYNVYQKIGEWWPYYNHSAAFVDSSKDYSITVMSNYWTNHQLANFAKEIHTAAVK